MCLIAARTYGGARSLPGCEPRYAGSNVGYPFLWEANSSQCAARTGSPYDHECGSSVLVPNRTKEISATNAAKKRVLHARR